jgi:Cu-Zn family superoxide dismutase
MLGLALAGLAVLAASPALAAALTFEVSRIDASGVGQPLGTIVLHDTRYGLLIEPKLKGLPPGAHGFHVHEKGDCAAAMNNGQMAAGFAAGGHFDPKHTAKHRGPDSTEGHLGDLPVLLVDANGETTLPMMAMHVKVKDIRGHAVMVHAGGDNYLDEPQPLGGGGARIACGVAKPVSAKKITQKTN